MSKKRAAIIELHRAGKTNSGIIKILKAAKSTVYHTVNRFKYLNSTLDRPRNSRPQTSRTLKVINAVPARILRNPKRSMRKMACEIDVSEKTMRNIVKTAPVVSPIKLRTCHHLTNPQKEKRLTRSKILLNKMKSDKDTEEIIFSNEKMFNVEVVLNRQNNRILAKSSVDIPDSMQKGFRRQEPSSVMVWTAVSETCIFSTRL